MFDEFEEAATDAVQSRLDRFALELTRGQDLRGFIVGFRTPRRYRGSALRKVHGFLNYLINMRGVASTAVVAVDGGVREKSLTELWLAPIGASFPQPSAPMPLALDQPMKFDSLTLGPDCEWVDTVELAEPQDSVRFFGEALNKMPATVGFIFVHPSTHLPISKAIKLSADSRESVVRKYGVGVDKIDAQVVSARGCLQMDFWLAPASMVPPEIARADLFFQRRMMVDSEENAYTIRLVEFVGNEHVRDGVLRRRILGLKEGEVFRISVLRKNLAKLSQLKAIRSVSLEDVDVNLDPADKTIDLNIFVKARPRANSRVH